MYGIIDFTCIDTDPGAASAFAPPPDFDGDYREYMRQRWKNDPGVRQHVAVAGRFIEQAVFRGRYAEEARRIAEAVWQGRQHDHLA